MLIASITSSRTGRMSDVVATIQAEQDRVIRATLQGVLVVQGGPGTGKTVAALHRAAYLLYTHRRTLERRGVLVIGPNATFLRYISQVLPSLGETDVVLSSIAELFPGVKAGPDDNPEAAVVKGDQKMVAVLRRAVRNPQQLPPGDLEVTADGVTMTVPKEVVLRARDRAAGCASRTTWPASCSSPTCSARSRRPRRGRSAASSTPTTSRTPGRLWDEAPVRAALDGLWPFLTRSGWSPACWPPKVPSPGRSRFYRGRTSRAAAPRRPRRVDGGGRAAARRGRSAARHRRYRGEDPAPGRGAGAPGEERYAREVLEITGLAGQGFVDAATLADWNRTPASSSPRPNGPGPTPPGPTGT